MKCIPISFAVLAILLAIPLCNDTLGDTDSDNIVQDRGTPRESASSNSNLIGFRFGLNLATMRTEIVADQNPRAGLNVAFVYFLDRGGIISSVMEFGYSQKGTKVSSAALPAPWAFVGSSGRQLVLEYMEFNALLRSSFPTGRTRPFLLAGLNTGYLLDAKAKLGGSGQSIDVNDFVEDFDLGLLIGGGTDIPIGQIRILIDVRYTFSLSGIEKIGDQTVKNSVFSLSTSLLW